MDKRAPPPAPGAGPCHFTPDALLRASAVAQAGPIWNTQHAGTPGLALGVIAMTENPAKPEVKHFWLIPVPGRAHPLLIPFEPESANVSSTKGADGQPAAGVPVTKASVIEHLRALRR